jgi:hypothetical protein
MDGTASRTGSGLAVSSYAWTLSEKPVGSLARLSSGTASRPTIKADEPGRYGVSLIVGDGTLNSSASTVDVTAIAGAWAETTVVFRVVATSPLPGWGQEPVPGWPAASPIKDAPNYRLYDVEIARDTLSRPVQLNLLKFQNWDRTKGWTAVDFTAYRADSTVYSMPLSGSSSDLMNALTAAVHKVMQRESATRFVIEYSGHGGPLVFFEGTLTMSDARSFVQNVRSAIGDAVLVLDFSTNCDVGFFDFAMNFHDKADYLVASDLQVGGFDPGDVTAWLTVQHDNNLQSFFSSEKSAVASLKSVITSRRAVWALAQASIASLKVQQSLSVFSLSEFVPLMRAVKAIPAFDPLVDIPRNSWSLATYIYSTNSPELISALERFRFLYTSSRDLLVWTSNERGFGVSNTQTLKTFLQTFPS